MKHILLVLFFMTAAARAEMVPAAPADLGSSVINAASFGAKGDGVADDTKALQAAIDATAEKHGVLTLKPGVYLTGSLFLKSGMTLRLDDGVRLLGAQKIAAYERRPTRIAGIEMTWPAALLNVYGQRDVRIVGSGAIDGDGKVFWQSYWALRKVYEPQGLRWASDYDAERPRLIQIYNSERVELGGGLKLTRSGFWTVQIVYSHDVKVSGVTIRNNVDGLGPSTDGIDIDSSHHILVENADIDVHDDALCLKAGRDADGLRVNRPSEHIVIRHSVVRAATAGITFGSETSGGIHDVDVYGITVLGPAGSGILFKSAAMRGGIVSNIRLRDIDIRNVGTAIRFDLNWNVAYSYAKIPPDRVHAPEYWKVLATPVPPDRGLPHVRGIDIQNVKAQAREALHVAAYPQAPVEDMRLTNIDVSAQTAGTLANVRDFHFVGLRLQTKDGSVPVLEDAEDVTGLP